MATRVDLLGAFTNGLEKHAVSMGLALKALKGRVAQGASVSPGLIRTMESDAAYGMPLAKSHRRVIQQAGKDVRNVASGKVPASAMETPTRVSMLAGKAGPMQAAPGGKRLTAMPGGRPPAASGVGDTVLPPPGRMPSGVGVGGYAPLPRPAAMPGASMRPGLAYAKTQLPPAAVG
jgi:hypothetical protein